MPQAANADSTSAPARQRLNIDVFQDTINEIEALSFMIGTVLSGDTLPPDISSGITSLFRGVTAELHQLMSSAKDTLDWLETLLSYEKANNKIMAINFEFSNEERAFNQYKNTKRQYAKAISVKLNSLAALELDRAATHYHHPKTSLAEIIINQWLIRNGWLVVPDKTINTATKLAGGQANG